MENAIRIVIADDHEFYLDGLKNFFHDQEAYRVVGEAMNGVELVQKVKELKPHIVLTDLRMPLLQGYSAIQKILLMDPTIKCMVITSYENDISIIQALESGAIGYITKNMPKSELFVALDHISRGYPYYCKSTNTKMIRLLSRSRFNPYQDEKPPVFTEQEYQIICFICEEKSNKEMAVYLNISLRTLENIRARIYKKMKVRSAAGAVIYAIKHNLFIFED